MTILLILSLLIPSTFCIVYEPKTSNEIRSHLEIVNPGDEIHLTDGFFTGPFIIQRNGTFEYPIVLKGSHNSILSWNASRAYGIQLLHANHWILEGFTVTQSKMGIILDYSNYNLIENVKVHGLDQEGIHLRYWSSHNVIKNNIIYDLGIARHGYGEGIYIGQSWSKWIEFDNQPDACDFNQIIGNVIGPDVRGESIDIKEGTCCGLIQGNVFNGEGMTGVHYDDAWIDLKGEKYVIENNWGRKTLKDGFWVHNELPAEFNKTSACDNTFRDNFCNIGDVKGYCVALNGQAVLNCNNIVLDSNKVIGGTGLTNGLVTSECNTK